MDYLQILIRDSKFWTALVLLVKVVLFYALPDFPQEVWGAIDALLVVVISVLTAADVTKRYTIQRLKK